MLQQLRLEGKFPLKKYENEVKLGILIRFFALSLYSSITFRLVKAFRMVAHYYKTMSSLSKFGLSEYAEDFLLCSVNSNNYKEPTNTRHLYGKHAPPPPPPHPLDSLFWRGYMLRFCGSYVMARNY